MHFYRRNVIKRLPDDAGVISQSNGVFSYPALKTSNTCNEKPSL